MNNTLKTSLWIALATGIVIFLYNKRKNKPEAVAEDGYNDMDDTFRKVENISEAMFA